MEEIIRFEDLDVPDKVTIILRASQQRFYLDRELQRYKDMEGWWITIKGGRRVFVEARYVIRGNVDQDFAGEVMDSFRDFSPKFLSRTTYVSIAPAQEEGWWIFEKDAGLLGQYTFSTKHIVMYDDDAFRTGHATVGGTAAHELSHSHFSRNAMTTQNPDRPAAERKAVDKFVDSVVEENAVASGYAWSSYQKDIELGHAENFAEWAEARYEAKAYGGKYEEKWKKMQAMYPKSHNAFMTLWKSYGGA